MSGGTDMKGRVIKYFEEKAYGFVQDENGESRFFHISNVKELNEISKGNFS